MKMEGLPISRHAWFFWKQIMSILTIITCRQTNLIQLMLMYGKKEKNIFSENY
jgi:hypothetical protein